MKTPRLLRGVGVLPVLLVKPVSSLRTRQHSRFYCGAGSIIRKKDPCLKHVSQHIAVKYTIIKLAGQLSIYCTCAVW